MLKTESDRLNYGNIFMPPDGYRLEKAIGTSYSLDLEALTAVAIALGLHEQTDSEIRDNPICLLNAIQKVSDRILLFCEAGQTKMPENPSALCILLEKMIVPVALPRKKKMNRYPAFHPKMWLLQYFNERRERKHRFIVLSRNLTFDRSWDISVVLDSSEQDEPVDQPEKTQPIINFLQFLSSQISGGYVTDRSKRKLIKSLCNELEGVSFTTGCKEFYDFEVLPLGIGKGQYDMSEDALFQGTFHEAVVMSPFLSGSIIENLNQDSRGLTNCKRSLITRKSELGKLKASQVNNFDIYTLKDAIVDGEDGASDESMKKQKQDIHAKLYLTRKYSNTNLYIGSMNASYAAIHHNVEMMIWLTSKYRYLNGDALLKDLFGGDADNPQNPFEKTEIRDEEAVTEGDESDQIEQLIKKICRMKRSAIVTEREGRYDLLIFFDESLDSPFRITVSPLRSRKEVSFSKEMKITDLDILQLSEFYRIKVSSEETTVERVIMIPTEGLPDDREAAVVNSILSDRKSFIEYIAFVLGDDYLISFLEKQKMGESGIFRSDPDAAPPVYEKMLRTALNEPERLNEISYIMNMITDDGVVPDEFRRMYEMFRKTLKLK